MKVKIKDVEKIEKELLAEKKRLVEIEHNIENLSDMLERRPAHFSWRDFVISFFGALIIGLSFIHKGALIRISKELTSLNIVLIILMTSIFLILEIYFVGYKRVKDKKERPLGQFLIKRFVTLYFVALLVPTILVFVYGINKELITNLELFKFVLSVSMPCAIGAAIVDLLKKY